uniref:Uncharacterized protein n=1 Tax=Lygus hesperus TaxID=30085 RepID=A0A0K8SEX9_LYGHE
MELFIPNRRFGMTFRVHHQAGPVWAPEAGNLATGELRKTEKPASELRGLLCKRWQKVSHISSPAEFAIYFQRFRSSSRVSHSGVWSHSSGCVHFLQKRTVNGDFSYYLRVASHISPLGSLGLPLGKSTNRH